MKFTKSLVVAAIFVVIGCESTSKMLPAPSDASALRMPAITVESGAVTGYLAFARQIDGMEKSVLNETQKKLEDRLATNPTTENRLRFALGLSAPIRSSQELNAAKRVLQAVIDDSSTDTPVNDFAWLRLMEIERRLKLTNAVRSAHAATSEAKQAELQTAAALDAENAASLQAGDQAAIAQRELLAARERAAKAEAALAVAEGKIRALTVIEETVEQPNVEIQ